MQAVGQVIEGSSYLAQGNYNQKIAERNALMAERDGAAESAVAREQSRKAIGAQLTAQAGSGFEMGTGTPLNALMESQVNATLDALTIRRGAATKAQGLRQQGQLAKMEGKQRAVASYFGAAKSLAETAKSYAGAG